MILKLGGRGSCRATEGQRHTVQQEFHPPEIPWQFGFTEIPDCTGDDHASGGRLRSSFINSIILTMQEMNHQMSERSIVIVGVGLIGGSIAAAVRHRFPNCQVVGIGRNPERLAQAKEMSLLTSWSLEISADAIPEGSLGIVCLPVHQIAQAVRTLLEAGCEVVTDAGSVKQCVYDSFGSQVDRRFVGSHPIAGSEQSGFEHADADLFSRRLCVVTTVTPEDAAEPNVQRVVEFWKSLGSSVYLMSPDEHDRVLALTSHLPHVLASVAAGCVEADLLKFAGSGYRDTTRIAAGSASLWTSILMGNSKHCVESIRAAEELLKNFRDALTAGDSAALEQLWEKAAQQRRMLNRDSTET